MTLADVTPGPRQRAQDLYAHHWCLLVRSAAFALRDYAHADAEDLVAQIMADVCAGELAGLPPGDTSAVAFIRGVIRNRAAHINRRERRLVPLPELADDEDPWARATRILVTADVEVAMTLLTPRQREVAVRHWLQQESTPEISAALGIAPRTVKELLRRAAKELRTTLSCHNDER